MMGWLRRVVPIAVAAMMAAGSGAYAQEATTATEATPETARAVMSQAQANIQTFDSNGVPIAYQVEGEGEPVLLTHGFALNGTIQWSMVRPALVNAGYKVISIDNRGHGQSGKPHDPEQYGQEMVEDQVRLLDHLGIDKAHVIGYSMGGGITLNLLTQHPDRVHSAAITGAGWNMDAGDEEGWREEFAQALDEGRGFELLFERLAPPDEAGEGGEGTQQMKAFESLLTQMNDQKALAAVTRSRVIGMNPTPEEIAEIDTPTILVIGSRDPIIAAAKSLNEARPDMELVEIDGATHGNVFLRPEFVQSLVNWVKAHPMEEGAGGEAAAEAGASEPVTQPAE